MTLTILFRFSAMAEKRHSSVTAEMPLFRIFERQYSRFIAEKLSSAHIFLSRIMCIYSTVPTRLCPLKNVG